MGSFSSLLNQKHVARWLLPLTFIAVLAACGGSSGSGAPAADPTDITTPDDNTPPAVTPPDDETPAPETPVGEVPVVTPPDDDDAENPTRPPRPPRPPIAVDHYDRPDDYPNMVTLPLQFLSTANGKQLGAIVTLPADENGNPAPGPFPTILVQTAYNIGVISLMKVAGGSLLGAPDKYMVKRGYAMVAVDVVGTGVSQGGWEMIGAEEQAGYGDAVDWVTSQPWSDGKVAVAGVSYMAITSLLTAAQRPDAVKAVFALVPMGDAQRGTVGTGGLLNGVFMSVWLTLTQTLTTLNDLTELANPDHASQIAAATQEHIDQIDNYYLPVIESALNGDPEITYDGEFWRTRSPIEQIDSIKAPTFILGALQDIFQRDEPLLYERLKHNTDTRLVIYDGDHISNFLQALPGGDEVDPILPLMLQWFDKHVKGMDTNTEAIPPVTQYVKNLKRFPWHGFVSTTDWPHPQLAPERWYLRGDRSLDARAPETEEPGHDIDAAQQPDVAYGKSANGKRLEFKFTLNDGTRCSVSFRQWTLGAAGLSPDNCYDENTELDVDALNFDTAPMADDYYLNGPMQADIWISTTGENAVLSVWINEVTPQGESLPIANGLLLASARAVDTTRSRFINGEMIQPYHFLTQEAELPVVPGEVFKMQVEIFPSSYIVRKGNRLRVSIASSNQAQGILNYPRQAQVIGSTMTIHNSAEYPSSVLLPVVPLSALP